MFRRLETIFRLNIKEFIYIYIYIYFYIQLKMASKSRNMSL